MHMHAGTARLSLALHDPSPTHRIEHALEGEAVLSREPAARAWDARFRNRPLRADVGRAQGRRILIRNDQGDRNTIAGDESGGRLRISFSLSVLVARYRQPNAEFVWFGDELDASALFNLPAERRASFSAR
jgi:hypothetical protein